MNFTKNWRLLAILMIVLQSVLYAILDLFSKLAYGKVPIYSFLTVRYLLATGIMLLQVVPWQVICCKILLYSIYLLILWVSYKVSILC